MSSREMVLSLLDNIPDSKLGYVIAYLQGLSAGETSDDEFCEQLYNSYLNSTDNGDAVSFEKMAEMCGVNPNEL